ncbi:MAG: Dyp-type peroxidase [Lachnospiraceae bacterium]|jgi:putative iron-dependent peroxidase|nr:Dyp-type peroxidase [Lachnospiraceae bacterium]
MSINPLKAQDVYKDIGENVTFVVLKLNRANRDEEVETIEDFADKSQAIIRSLRIRASKDNLKVAIGFSNLAWEYLFPKANKPKELETFKGIQGEYPMPASEGDIFLHVRASKENVVYECISQFMTVLSPITTVVNETKGFRYFEGRAILGFIDGTEVPSEADTPAYAVIGDEDPEFINGSYAFAQKWQHDMGKWNSTSTEEQEKAIGRKKFSDLELEDDEKAPNAHTVSAKLDIDGVEQKIVRMNVPFSEPAQGITGTYFIGYSRRWEVTKGMLTQMVEKGDYLLTFSKLLSGQLFFIPSRDTLEAIADGEYSK